MSKREKLPRSGPETIKLVSEGIGTVKLDGSNIIYREKHTNNTCVTKCQSVRHATKMLAKWQKEYEGKRLDERIK